MSFTGSHDSSDDSSSGGSSVDTAATSSQNRLPINIELDLPTSVHADTESDVAASHVVDHEPIETSSAVYSLGTDFMSGFHPALAQRHVSPADPTSPAPGAHVTSRDRTQAQAQILRPAQQVQVPRPAHDDGRSVPRVSSQSDTPAVMISRRTHLAPHPGRDPWEIVIALVRAYLSAQEPEAARGRGARRKAMSVGDVDRVRARWEGIGVGTRAGKAASTGSAADASSIDVPPPIALMNEHMSDQGKTLDGIRQEMAEQTKETKKQTREMAEQTKVLRRQELETKTQTELIRKHTESIHLLGDKFDNLSDKISGSMSSLGDKNVRGFENVVESLQNIGNSLENSFDRSLMKAVKHLEEQNQLIMREAIREGLKEVALSRARE